jgi:hypothetical protein
LRDAETQGLNDIVLCSFEKTNLGNFTRFMHKQLNIWAARQFSASNIEMQSD